MARHQLDGGSTLHFLLYHMDRHFPDLEHTFVSLMLKHRIDFLTVLIALQGPRPEVETTSGEMEDAHPYCRLMALQWVA